MKKQTVVIIWSVAVLLLVVGSVLGFKFGFGKKDNGSSTEIFECLPSDIVSYSVDNGHGNKYKLVRQDDEWKIENNDVAVINSKKAEELMRCASKITATGIVKNKEISDKNGDVRTVKIGISDGSEFAMTFLGEEAGMCMFKIAEEDTVYTMYTSTRDILTAPLDSLRDLQIFTEFDDDENMPELYEYTDYDKSKVSIRLKTGWELSQDDKNQFMMTEPYYRSVDDDKFTQQVLVKIPAIMRSGSYVYDYPEDLSVYGLDRSGRATLKISRNGAESILYLGKTDNGLVYAQKEGQDEVFAIASAQLEFLNTEPFYLIDSRLLESDIEGVSRVSVKLDGATYELKRNVVAEGSEWFSINGKNTNKEAFDEIISLINEIEVVSELATFPPNTRDIVIRVYYSGKAAAPEVALVPAGEKEYAVFVNGKAEFAAEKQKIDDIIERIKK